MAFEPVLGTNRFKWKKKRAMQEPTCKQREIRSAEFPGLKVKNQAWHNRTSADFVDLEHLIQWKCGKCGKQSRWRTWELWQLDAEVGMVGWQL